MKSVLVVKLQKIKGLWYAENSFAPRVQPCSWKWVLKKRVFKSLLEAFPAHYNINYRDYSFMVLNVAGLRKEIIRHEVDWRVE